LSLLISVWLAFTIGMGNSALLVPLFTIQHDWGNGAFVGNRGLGDLLPRTPYS